MTQPLILFRKQATSLLRDYAELVKLRVTTLIVMTAWCGYYFGAQGNDRGGPVARRIRVSKAAADSSFISYLDVTDARRALGQERADLPEPVG